MAPLADLELTIQSRYPFVAVEKALSDIAADLCVPFFVWTVTSGLRRAGLLDPMYDTRVGTRPRDGELAATARRR